MSKSSEEVVNLVATQQQQLSSTAITTRGTIKKLQKDHELSSNEEASTLRPSIAVQSQNLNESGVETVKLYSKSVPITYDIPKADSEYYAENFFPSSSIEASLNVIAKEDNNSNDIKHKDLIIAKNEAEKETQQLTLVASAGEEQGPTNSPIVDTIHSLSDGKVSIVNNKKGIDTISRVDSLQNMEAAKFSKLQNVKTHLTGKKDTAEQIAKKGRYEKENPWESDEAELMLGAFKSIQFTIPIEEPFSTILPQLSLRLMRQHRRNLYTILLKQSEHCHNITLQLGRQLEKENSQLINIKEAYEMLKDNLNRIRKENERAEQVRLAKMTQLKIMHWQNAYRTKVNDPEIEALIERRDHLKLMLFSKKPRPYHADDVSDTDTVSTYMMEDVTYDNSPALIRSPRTVEGFSLTLPDNHNESELLSQDATATINETTAATSSEDKDLAPINLAAIKAREREERRTESWAMVQRSQQRLLKIFNIR